MKAPTEAKDEGSRFSLAGGGHLGFFGSLQRAAGGMGTERCGWVMVSMLPFFWMF